MNNINVDYINVDYKIIKLYIINKIKYYFQENNEIDVKYYNNVYYNNIVLNTI